MFLNFYWQTLDQDPEIYILIIVLLIGITYGIIASLCYLLDISC